MAVKSAVNYTPENVAKGLRDLIAFWTSHRPNIDIYERVGGYEARVFLSTAALETAPRLEQNLRDILPDGYELKMHWT